jgi:hypothetical protein
MVKQIYVVIGLMCIALMFFLSSMICLYVMYMDVSYPIWHIISHGQDKSTAFWKRVLVKTFTVINPL